MYWIVDTQRELYNSFGSNFTFLRFLGLEELIYYKINEYYSIIIKMDY